MVPPYRGCGWHTSAACVAPASPALRSASSLPAGPLRKNDLIPLATESFYHRAHRRHGGRTPPPSLAKKDAKQIQCFLVSVFLCVLGGKAWFILSERHGSHQTNPQAGRYRIHHRQ